MSIFDDPKPDGDDACGDAAGCRANSDSAQHFR